MGKFAKWIGGGLGWAFLGPVGGILGFLIGSVMDEETVTKKQVRGKTTTGDFVTSMLVLVAAVLKADGKVMKSELDVVKNYFIRTFGKESASEALVMLRSLLKQDIPVRDVSIQIGRKLDYSSRLQLLHFLYNIAVADGNIHDKEIEVIDLIANNMGLSYKDRESIKSMFVKKKDSYYKILEIEPDAGNEEVKKAYRKMALKYHPDKVSHLGEDFKKVAEEKFQKVNEAYQHIRKERNMD